jgi:hypothetical protein
VSDAWRYPTVTTWRNPFRPLSFDALDSGRRNGSCLHLRTSNSREAHNICSPRANARKWEVAEKPMCDNDLQENGDE